MTLNPLVEPEHEVWQREPTRLLGLKHVTRHLGKVFLIQPNCKDKTI